MRILVEPETGEMVEVLETDTVGLGPYDIETGRRAVMAQSREKRTNLGAHEAAVSAKAEAEAWYRVCLAKAVLTAKAEHGATVAEVVAKGTEEVAQAREQMLAAEGLERSAFERLRLGSEDRASIHRLIEWSAQQERFTGGEAG